MDGIDSMQNNNHARIGIVEPPLRGEVDIAESQHNCGNHENNNWDCPIKNDSAFRHARQYPMMSRDTQTRFDSKNV